MNAIRASALALVCRVLAGTLGSLTLLGAANADVRTIEPTQYLPRPPTPTFTWFGQGVAIEGGNIIVLATFQGGQSALLYQRNSAGTWVYRRVLQSVSGPPVTASVRMKNGIAAVQIGNQVSIFEYSGGNYVLGRTAAPLRHPGGLAISQNRVLVGGDDCDYDAVIYQKGTDGIWGITGRLDDNQGECQPQGLAVELNYDYALVRVPYTQQMRAWRRNGTALAWLPAGILVMPPDTPVAQGSLALQSSTAVTPGSVVFRRSGTTWTTQGTAVPVDYGNGAGLAFHVVYRDGVLITTESWFNFIPARPYVYLETSPGTFEHLAILQTPAIAVEHDISGRTVVAATRQFTGPDQEVMVFTLPLQLRAPPPIVNDFEQRDVSQLTFNGGQFALATRGTDDVLAQTFANGRAVALFNDSDWSDYQRIEADIAPTFGAGDSWVGLVARYIDADNYYFVAIRSNGSFGLYRRLNGADTLLDQGNTAHAVPWRVTLTVQGDEIMAGVNRQNFALARDSSLTHGRAGLATSFARADFDEVHAAATAPLSLVTKSYVDYGFDFGRPFTKIGGNWQVRQDESGNNPGLYQLDGSGNAVAFIGTPVENQEVTTRVRVDAFNSSPQGAWFGMLARYVDARNYYYVTVRSTNQVQIRKMLNGVITVLASVNFTAAPGVFNEYSFRLIHDQLQLFVNGVLVTSVHDDDIPRGQYGIGTYRATATWDYFYVAQP